MDRTILLIAALFLAACATTPVVDSTAPPLDVVPQVDLARYAGRWYEIASFPQSFQEGCTDSRAEYSLRKDGEVDVVNSCLRNGKIDTAKGRAWVVEPETNAKLKVSFFWPFRGDYWIIELGIDYGYAVVASPSRQYLWILSRSPQMPNMQYNRIVERLKERGFDVSRLKRTEQGNRTDW